MHTALVLHLKQGMSTLQEETTFHPEISEASRAILGKGRSDFVERVGQDIQQRKQLHKVLTPLSQQLWYPCNCLSPWQDPASHASPMSFKQDLV